MIQLKRFEFNYYTNKNEKILHRFEYPETVDFSKWQITSTGPCEYELYAVLVHEGLKSESGHYYAYIQVDDDWYRFNDQEVSRATIHQVFEYNFGGDIDTVEFDSREFKVNNRKTIASSTAYMLVYVKKDLKEKILNSEPIYPSWLKEHEIIKQEEREENRNRKNFFHDVPALYWSADLKDEESDYLGLFPKNFELIETEIIKKVPKNEKIEEWIKPFNEKGMGVYLYLTCLEKTEYETLINLQHRKSTFSDLIRDTGSNITIIYFPIQVNFDNYLYIIKLLTVKPSMQEEKENELEIAIHFHEFLEISRSSKNSELINKLKQMFSEEGFEFKFYYEEKKELIQIKEENSLVKGPASVRNILGVIIVEKIPIHEANEQQNYAMNWYNDQKNMIEITVKSEDGKYSFSTEIDQSKSVESFRQFIFENKVNKDEDYFSPENIVLKTKPKKTAKNFVEVSGAKTIKDLIKNCDKENIVVFSYSNLKADERVNQVEVKFCYRFQDFSFSDFFHIILDRKCTNQSESMYLKISNHEEIKKMTQKENLSSIRILLFSKEKSVINDIVSENGHVHGKGEIAQVLQKEKGIQLVVIGFNQEIIEENFCPVLLQHRSQNNEKIGTPRYLEFPRETLLTVLYNEILDLIKDESYEWEEKKIKCCPAKIYLFAYTKDISKGIYIYDEATMKQHALNEERQLEKDAKKLLKKEKELQNSNKKEDQSENQQSNLQLQEIIVIDDLSIVEEPKNDMNFLLPPKNARANESDENEEENSNDGPSSQPQSKRKNSKIEKLKDWERTINSAFSKARVLRIFVEHPYICKAQTAMRLNVL